MSRSIERSEAVAFFMALHRGESPLVFWSFDRTNGEQQLVEGYVSSVNETLLEIEKFANELTFVLIAGVHFIQLEVEDAPPPIRAVAKVSYDFVLGFHAGKYACCVMGKDLRNIVAAE